MSTKYSIIYQEVFMILKFKLMSFLFARNVAKPIAGATNTRNVISEGEGGLTRRITDNSNGGITGIQSATTTLARNTVTIMGLIESSELELIGMQEAVDDISEIVHSFDNVLQKFEAVDSNLRIAAKQE